jgi:putative NADPH-quinone reductase
VLSHGWAYGHNGIALRGKSLMWAVTTGGGESHFGHAIPLHRVLPDNQIGTGERRLLGGDIDIKVGIECGKSLMWAVTTGGGESHFDIGSFPGFPVLAQPLQAVSAYGYPF